MLDKLKQFVIKMNTLGIPLPLLRDNKTGKGSISYTFLVISGLIVLIGLLGKFSKILDVDLAQAEYWFLTCAGLYYSRSISGDSKNIRLDTPNGEKERNNNEN